MNGAITSKEQFSHLVERIQNLKKEGVDLSRDEDLSLAVMNLLSLEEHFFFTAEKTGKDNYFDLLKETREIRKALLAKIIDRHEGETWCASKHLLSTAMRLIEVGVKLQAEAKKTEAKEIFDYAYKIYSIFWGLRLKLITLPDVKKIAADEKHWTLQDIVSKLVNCCDQ